MPLEEGDKYNPFKPDDPVPPDLFVGRKKEMAVIEGALRGTTQGTVRNVLVIGEKGIGKTSLAGYVSYLAEGVEAVGKYGGQFFTVYCSLGGCQTPEDVCVAILKELHNKIRVKDAVSGVVERTKDFFDNLTGFGLTVGVVGLNFSKRPNDKSDLPLHFHHVIQDFTNRFRGDGPAPRDSGAVLIILDELDSISRDKNFAPFLKSYLENTSRINRGVMHLVTASIDAVSRLEEGHETIRRGFRPLYLEDISNEETEDLFKKALDQGIPKKGYSSSAIQLVYSLASGIPNFVQELGWAAFEVDTDDLIDDNDVISGVFGTEETIGALRNLELKFFRKRYHEMILSNRYRRILGAMALTYSDNVKVSTIKEKLSEEDAKFVSQYLATMVKRGVVVKVKNGVYSLPDRMFKLFLRMEAVKVKGKGKKAGG